jgi:hypothetical protein
MFLLVTTNAAVAEAAETSIATMPAMIAAFIVLPPSTRWLHRSRVTVTPHAALTAPHLPV